VPDKSDNRTSGVMVPFTRRAKNPGVPSGTFEVSADLRLQQAPPSVVRAMVCEWEAFPNLAAFVGVPLLFGLQASLSLTAS
jgi:hypothetical protein